MLNLDLHSHSRISDGSLSPRELVFRAKDKGVDVLALTDHDEVRGLGEARAAAEEAGIRLVSGVEISITWAGETIHIVGLQIDETSKSLTEGLFQTRGGRASRARGIASKLAALGIPGAFEGTMKYVTNPHLISRKHFARFLVEVGASSDIEDAFVHYLKQGQRAFVPHRWANLTDAINWIHRAGGIAVLAHPGRYNLSDTAFSAFLDEFKQLGGTGIEVISGRHAPGEHQKFANVAKRYGLMASVGSDFHSPGESPVELGALPPLPSGLKPVWHDWF